MGKMQSAEKADPSQIKQNEQPHNNVKVPEAVVFGAQASNITTKESKSNKLQLYLKEFVRKSELLFSLLNDDAINSLPSGKTVSVKTSYTELENFTRTFRKTVQLTKGRCKWSQDYIHLLEHELNEITEERAIPILWDDVENENIKSRVQFFISGIQSSRVNDVIPLVDGTKIVNESEVGKLKGEIIELTNKLLSVRRDEDIKRDSKINDMVRKHEVQLARWKKDELSWRSKQRISTSDIDSLNEQLDTMRSKMDIIESELKGKSDECDRLLNNSQRRSSPVGETSETSFRLLMKQLSSTESRLAKSTTEIETLRAKIAMLQNDVCTTPTFEEPFRRRSQSIHLPPLTSDKVTVDINDSSGINDKYDYLKQIIRTFIQYTDAGDKDKANLVLPAIKAVMNS